MTNPQNQDEVDSVVQDALREAQSAVTDIQSEIDHTLTGDDEQQSAAPMDSGGIELLSDVDLDVMIELGRTEMLVEDVLRLGSGSVVELDKLAGDPVDVHVNGRLVARGEVLVLNDNFCIRISEIIENLEEQAAAAAAEAQEAEQATVK
jgi:flagellar motor switch protein FliN/FliY